MLCDPKVCTGCQACAQRCPNGSITMVPDAEGFLAPQVDETRCTGCGLCESVCPQLVAASRADGPLHTYGVKCKDEKMRFASTSGGAFYTLAESVLRSGGVVFGCKLDETAYARHSEADTMEKLIPLLGSKYVQSDIDGTFVQAKKRLDEGKDVLFVGTGCQIAGLKLFLKRDYDNLYTLELICKGVPSPALLKEYVSWREKRLGAPLIKFSFRTKEAARWGVAMALRFETKLGVRYCTANVDPYFNSYLKSYTLRNCCYSCGYNGKKRVGDMTVSDYWGLDYQFPEFFDTNGVSALMIYTEQGNRLWERSCDRFDWIETSFESAADGNKVYWNASRRPPERERAYADGFYPEMFDNNPVFRPTFADRAFAAGPDWFKKLAKRISRMRKGPHG